MSHQNLAIDGTSNEKCFCRGVPQNGKWMVVVVVGPSLMKDEDTLLWGPKWLHAYMFMIWELIAQLHRTSVTHGFLAGIVLCNLGAYEGTFCERTDYTHELSNYTHICYTKKCFQIMCVIISGLIVVPPGQFFFLRSSLPCTKLNS